MSLDGVVAVVTMWSKLLQQPNPLARNYVLPATDNTLIKRWNNGAPHVFGDVNNQGNPHSALSVLFAPVSRFKRLQGTLFSSPLSFSPSYSVLSTIITNSMDWQSSSDWALVSHITLCPPQKQSQKQTKPLWHHGSVVITLVCKTK